MAHTIAGSVAILMATMILSGLAVRSIASRLQSKHMRWTLISTLLALLLASIWLVDVQVPLALSHWRPDGETVPVWLALAAGAARIAVFGCFGVPRAGENNHV